MEKSKAKKYRIHTLVDNGYPGPSIKYVIQRRRFGFWWTISDEIKHEVDATKMLEQLTEYNEN